MSASLRIVALLLCFRLFMMDVEMATDWWSWATVGFDALLFFVIFADREPAKHQRKPLDDRY